MKIERKKHNLEGLFDMFGKKDGENKGSKLSRALLQLPNPEQFKNIKAIDTKELDINKLHPSIVGYTLLTMNNPKNVTKIYNYLKDSYNGLVKKAGTKNTDKDEALYSIKDALRPLRSISNSFGNEWNLDYFSDGESGDTLIKTYAFRLNYDNNGIELKPIAIGTFRDEGTDVWMDYENTQDDPIYFPPYQEIKPNSKFFSYKLDVNAVYKELTPLYKDYTSLVKKQVNYVNHGDNNDKHFNDAIKEGLDYLKNAMCDLLNVIIDFCNNSINNVNLEDLATEIRETNGIVRDISTDPEQPLDVLEEVQSVNPIEQDQAIEIADKHPNTKELDNLTTDEKVAALASDIDENTLDSNKVDSIAKTLDDLQGDDSLAEIIAANKEAYEVMVMTPVEVTPEDIANHPLQSREILLNEQQVIKNKANEKTWGTIKEDCQNMVKLIETSFEAIANKKSLKEEAIRHIREGQIVGTSYDLTTMLPTIGALRYFLTPVDNNGPMVDFLNLLMIITNTDSPKLTSADSNIIRAVNLMKPNSFEDAIEHIKTAIKTDALNNVIQEKVRNKPNAAVFSLFSRLTGGTVIEVLKEQEREDIEVIENYKDFLINTANIDLEGLKETLIDSISNFEARFKNTFNLLKFKYDDMDKFLKPLIMPNGNNNNEFITINAALSSIRFYYIEFVKNRLVDKLNAYQALLETAIRLFKVQPQGVKQ